MVMNYGQFNGARREPYRNYWGSHVKVSQMLVVGSLE